MRLALLAILALLASCNPAGVAVVDEGIVATAPTPEGRLERALGAVGAASLHGKIAVLLDKRPGKLMSDAPTKLKGVPEATEVSALFGDPALDAMWWANDEAAVAKALADREISYVLLRRDVAPSVDRGSAVASRLYHDDFREHFVLLAVDAEYLLYAPMVESRIFPPQLANVLALRLRELLKGEDPPALPNIQPPFGNRWNLIASVRAATGGREVAVGMCFRPELDNCVRELARDLEREHRRYVEWDGFPKLSERVDDLIVELHMVTERTMVLAFEEDDLWDLWEMGIDGTIIIDQELGQAAVFPGAVSYTRSYREPDKLLRAAAKQFNLSARRPWREGDNTLEKIRTSDYLHMPDGLLLPLFRGVPPVTMRQVDLPAIERSIVMAGEWYLRNLHPNDQPLRYEPGQVTYKQWPAENRYSDEYNLVRHTLATWNLVQAWHVDPRPEFLEGARSALDFTLRFRKDEGDMSFIEFDNNRKLGAVVVGLMGMIDLARATDDHQWDDLMVRFGNFTLFMQEEDGRFDPYYVPDDHPYAEEENDIVPGEAALALVMLYEYTGDEKWLAPLPKFLEFYEPWWDARVTQRNPESPWPAHTYANSTRLELVQFGPWSVMAANAYHRATGDDRFVDFGLRVARWMIETYQWQSDRTPWPDYVGGYYKMPRELPAMQAFCYAEGTAAAYQLALRARPEEAPFFERATRESVRLALQMQFDDHQIYPFTRGDEVRGGTRYALNETKVRIDYVHHALSALYQYLMAAREDPNLPEEVRLSTFRQVLEASQRRMPAPAPDGKLPQANPPEDGAPR
ncbi:MAG: hypothetical protein H6739_24725 [Alphaproteobacteria bacterium]|nr:hypothetical protein [Alphaproteobacteria bacterium]